MAKKRPRNVKFLVTDPKEQERITQQIQDSGTPLVTVDLEPSVFDAFFNGLMKARKQSLKAVAKMQANEKKKKTRRKKTD